MIKERRRKSDEERMKKGSSKGLKRGRLAWKRRRMTKRGNKKEMPIANTNRNTSLFLFYHDFLLRETNKKKKGKKRSFKWLRPMRQRNRITRA